MSLLFFVKKTIHRKLLEDYLKDYSLKIYGTILDIGSKDARYANWFKDKVISIDINPDSNKNVLKGDIYKLKFENSSFDSVLATEVFEYLEDPKQAISEIYRILKKDGILLLSAPLIYKVHEDLVRYTENFWKKLLKDFSKIEFHYIGNFYTIILDILRDKLVKNPNIILRYLLYLPFLILTLLIPLSKILSKDRNFVSGYLIFAKK